MQALQRLWICLIKCFNYCICQCNEVHCIRFLWVSQHGGQELSLSPKRVSSPPKTAGRKALQRCYCWPAKYNRPRHTHTHRDRECLILWKPCGEQSTMAGWASLSCLSHRRFTASHLPAQWFPHYLFAWAHRTPGTTLITGVCVCVYVCVCLFVSVCMCLCMCTQRRICVCMYVRGKKTT